ncbi:MAG: TPM domain-containing protein [Ignavibacteriaceae bacterium]|nr:TPM domain-containing protein [Ignavibacteriaceae bacterium]
MNKKFLHGFLSDEELQQIALKIKEKEATTAGEIVVSVKEKKPFFHRGKSVFEHAVSEFKKRGIKKTRDHTGILIFILLKEREFYILADSSINDKVADNTWELIKDKMEAKFHEKKFCEGIISAVDEVGTILSEHFPRKTDDTNELPDEVNIS